MTRCGPRFRRLDSSGDARSSARAHQRGEVDLGTSTLPDLVLAARQLVQLFHEARQPLDLLVDVAEHLRSWLDHAVGERLGEAAQAGERRAELVGHVLDQAAAEVLDALQRRRHPVEGLPPAAQLGVRRFGDPRRQVASRYRPAWHRSAGRAGAGHVARATRRPGCQRSPRRRRRSAGPGHVLVEHGLRLVRRVGALHDQVHDLLGAELHDREDDDASHDQRQPDEDDDEAGARARSSHVPALDRRHELVAHGPHGADEPRRSRIVTQLAAQPAEMDVDGAVDDPRIVIAHAARRSARRG